MKFFKMIKLISYGLIVASILFLFSIVIRFPDILNIIIFDIILIYIYVVLLTYLFSGNFNKVQYKNNISLYKWMDDLTDLDGYLLLNLNASKASYHTIDNLIRIKEVIEKRTKRDLITLKLYKAFYIQSSKDKMEDLYFKSVLLLMPALGVYLLRDFIPGVEGSNGNTVFLVVVVLLIIIILISDKLISNKRRAGLLVEIIDICIEEVQEEEELLKEKHKV